MSSSDRVDSCLRKIRLREIMWMIFAVLLLAGEFVEAGEKPNIILLMTDDLGYGDTGFNGNTIIKTPHLDALAARGTVLTNFHSGGSVCSPTRGTCLTGRHHDRYGIWDANAGHLPTEEITLAEVLKAEGYRTGHFGKWHLGTLDKQKSSKGAKRNPELHYSPPALHGYDRSFVTESAVCTWDPGYGARAKNNPFYDDGVAVDPKDPESNLRGGDARVLMDRAIPFIESSINDETPFFAVIWFHAPHEDVEAGPEYLAMYADQPEEARHYYGCITELDEQVGRLVEVLHDRGVTENTMIWFTSDNGPEGVKVGQGRGYGTTGGLRGRKRALYEGGVRVPSFVVWPVVVASGEKCDGLMSTLDYFPTISQIAGVQHPVVRHLDGENVLGMLTGRELKRGRPIPFHYHDNYAMVSEDFKYMYHSKTDHAELYGRGDDWAEANDVSGQFPDVVESMRAALFEWQASARESHAGGDYGDESYRSAGP